jgi:chromosome segregation ATPase
MASFVAGRMQKMGFSDLDSFMMVICHLSSTVLAAKASQRHQASTERLTATPHPQAMFSSCADAEATIEQLRAQLQQAQQGSHKPAARMSAEDTRLAQEMVDRRQALQTLKLQCQQLNADYHKSQQQVQQADQQLRQLSDRLQAAQDEFADRLQTAQDELKEAETTVSATQPPPKLQDPLCQRLPARISL